MGNVTFTLDRQVGRVLKDPAPNNTLQSTPVEQYQLQRGGRCCSGAKRYFGGGGGRILFSLLMGWVERKL